jgi:SAM-dependent methyltransferase
VALQDEHRAYYRGHVEELAGLVGTRKGALCLVDYGSSIPAFVREAKALGVANPIAVDLDVQSFAYAREHSLSIMTPDEYRARVPEGSVDVIRFAHVLEHLIDPSAAVATAVSKLKPGGLLYITQPGFPVFQARTTRYAPKDSVYPNHLHFFSPISLLKLLAPAPVDVIKFFTVTRTDEVYRETEPLLDLDYSRDRLAGLAGLGEECRGPRANYPWYTGENSALYARKRAAGAVA